MATRTKVLSTAFIIPKSGLIASNGLIQPTKHQQFLTHGENRKHGKFKIYFLMMNLKVQILFISKWSTFS
jgi:hypothetical protein